jgi:hypothetical protein
MTVFSLQPMETLKTAGSPYSCYECPWVYGKTWPWECDEEVS